MKKFILSCMLFFQLICMQQLSASYNPGDDQRNSWRKKMLEYIHAEDLPSQENIECFQAMIARAKFMGIFHEYAQTLLQESIEHNKCAYTLTLLDNAAHPNARSHFRIRMRN